MKILNYLFCLVVFVACKQSNTKSLKNLKSPILEKKVNIRAELLFGSKYLINLSNLNNETEVSRNHHLEIYRYYDKILYHRKTLPKPIIREIEYIKLEYRKPFIDSLTHNIDSIKYKIGKIGPYEAYYSSINFESFKFPVLSDTTFVCTKASNLILYNPQSQKAKVITVHYSAEESFYEENRFFYITKKNEIHIIDKICIDELSGCFFQKEYLLKINDKGKITVKKFKN